MYAALVLVAFQVAIGLGCRTDQFVCDNYDCIPSSWQCDNYYDCSDHSDELNCLSCPDYKCSSGNTCYSLYQKCNGYNDCSDGSDEDDCGSECIPCRYGNLCYYPTQRCDGVSDCYDGSDEDDCTTDSNEHGYITSNTGYVDTTGDCTYFQCDDGTCLSGDWECDDVQDCTDGSDESDCNSANLGLILGLSIPLSIIPFIPMIVVVVICHYRKKRRRYGPVVRRVATVPVQRRHEVIVVQCSRGELRGTTGRTPGGTRFVDGTSMGGDMWMDAPPQYTATADPSEMTITDSSPLPPSTSTSPLPPPYSFEDPDSSAAAPQECSTITAVEPLSPLSLSPNSPVFQSSPDEEEHSSFKDDDVNDRSPLLQQ